MKQTTKILLYPNFINDLSDGLIKELGGTYETRAIANTRNNGVTKRGILIRHQEETIAPAIYLEDYYQKYCEGMYYPPSPLYLQRRGERKRRSKTRPV